MIDFEKMPVFWPQHAADGERAYRAGRNSFVPYLLPEEALRLSAAPVLALLEARIGKKLLQEALDPSHATPSPLSGLRSTDWIKRTNMVGVNVRTIGSFWEVVKYALTLPEAQQSIHLLPIWEPGVVASLYGMASWNINPEFFSAELAEALPTLDTVEKQLKVVINLLHATGRTVGMDVIPHTDRYSEIALANPRHFEWLQRRGEAIASQRADLHEEVEEAVFCFLETEGAAMAGAALPNSAAELFSASFPESQRLELLFGQPQDYGGRGQRRGRLVQWLYEQGYEPVPATMGPPYRGIEIDTRPEAKSVDQEGRAWYEYKISQPQEMSRVFGPLTRYKLYEPLDDNRDWAIDFSRPRRETWEYVCQHYAAIQQYYHFDFMRGDMSHVQMRPAGVPARVDEHYDLHQAVGRHIRQSKPYFAYFAESFLTAPGFIAYGSEPDHLEQAEADSTLGDLQSMCVGSPMFMAHFRWYLDLLKTRRFAPNFTVMTGDKDDPRFDEYYLKGNEARLFIALFLADMPSYMALGFECRDPHPAPAPNEHYTKLYVFQIGDGPKATRRPYQWGKNTALFGNLTRLRLQAEELLPQIAGTETLWLLPPDPTAGTRVIAWTQAGVYRYLFVLNLDTERAAANLKIPSLPREAGPRQPRLAFSTLRAKVAADPLFFNGKQYQLDILLPGEGQVLVL
jgi:hypothetical protein